MIYFTQFFKIKSLNCYEFYLLVFTFYMKIKPFACGLAHKTGVLAKC